MTIKTTTAGAYLVHDGRIINALPGTMLGWSGYKAGGTDQVGVCQTHHTGDSALVHMLAFNASSAYTQFQTDAPQYAGMDYSVTDGKFYFYDGRGSTAGRIFTITPNGGTTWDMGLFSPGSGSDTPPATVSAGVHNRWTFVTVGRVKGFVFMPSASAGLYFLRTE